MIPASSFPGWGRPWVMPSLAMPRYETALLYPGTCLLEGTNLSEGRGTADPFALLGAPSIDAEALCREFDSLALPGLAVTPAYFTPTASKHAGTLCGGVHLHVMDAAALRPTELGLRLLALVRDMYPKDFALLPPVRADGRPFISLLAGHRGTRAPRLGRRDAHRARPARVRGIRRAAETLPSLRIRRKIYGHSGKNRAAAGVRLPRDNAARRSLPRLRPRNTRSATSSSSGATSKALQQLRAALRRDSIAGPRTRPGCPAFITIDQEGGMVTRLPRDAVNVPGSHGACRDRRAGKCPSWPRRSRCGSCAALGVNFNHRARCST